MSKKLPIEVCFSPAMYHRFHNDEAIVVIVDILRATSAICTAFMNGASQIIPVQTVEEAREYKQKGYLVAAERDGIKCDFADLGNSPFNFTKEVVHNKTLVYSTTNGTQAILMAENSYKIVVGAFLNISALTEFIVSHRRPVVIFCAGWKDRFSLEDTIFAGALAERLLQEGQFTTVCDSTIASLDLWSIAKHDVLAYIEKAAQRHRLKKNGLDDVLEYCFTSDLAPLVPEFSNNVLVVEKYCENINNFYPNVNKLGN
ncbi:MAG TPA: 2-phosphosulfolactate phosphatase [Bacteroidales bacterium]|nr:2-phosphosulfolactate phosphatase [Bacteroidales bacterium]HPO64987.1 2-phosphosulfolactate phosphatase [Bacteroidales bacterium]